MSRRLGKSGRIDRNVLLHLLQLRCCDSIWLRNGPTEWNLPPLSVTIVAVVDLRWNRPQRRGSIPHYSHQQLRLIVEIERERRLTNVGARNHIRWPPANLFRILDPQLRAILFDVDREVKIGIDPGSL